VPLAIQVVVLAIAVALAAAWFYRSGRRADDVRRSRLADREDISVEEFKRRYYAAEKIEAPQLGVLLDEVAQALNVPRGKLRPTDRFRVELAPEKGWEADDGVGILAQLLAKRGAAPADGILIAVQTLDEYLKASAVQQS
jgi:hypothetical protein